MSEVLRLNCYENNSLAVFLKLSYHVGILTTETRTGMGIYKDNTTSQYTYDMADKLTRSTTLQDATANSKVYTHDRAGNVTGDGTYTYAYDVGNRVILRQGNGERIRYNYDADGNLVQEISSTGTKTYEYNDQGKLIGGMAENGDISTYYYNGLGVRVVTEQLQENVNAVYQNNKFENGSRFMQDYMPVLIDTRNVWQRVYETEVGTTVQNDPEFVRKQYITDYTSIANRDILVYEEGSYIQRYVYGLNGERTSAEFFYYDETERTSDLLNLGENLASDFAADDIKKIYYFRNLLDSTMLAMDREGEIITHMRYDEWGRALEEPRLDHNFAGIKNLNNYTGYTYDYVLDLYFAQNRFYNADTRQFITQDPIKDGMNWYVYCEANPLVNVDWWGYWTFAVGGEVNVAFMGRFAGGIQVALDDNWNIGVIGYVGVGGGSAAASINVVATGTNADEIFDLEGISLVIGGSVSNVGAEGLVGTARDDSLVVGVTGSMSITPQVVPGELHGELVDTTVMTSINLKDTAADLWNGVAVAACGVDRSVKNLNAPANLNKDKLVHMNTGDSVASIVRGSVTSQSVGKLDVPSIAQIPSTETRLSNDVEKGLAVRTTGVQASGRQSSSTITSSAGARTSVSTTGVRGSERRSSSVSRANVRGSERRSLIATSSNITDGKSAKV